jgi:predicted transcriptional regulator YheO
METRLNLNATALVDFIARSYGENCEVVLLDLRPERRCVTAIHNGQISGRAVGSPLTETALRMEKSGIWKTRDHVCNYPGKAGDGRSLRSSVYFIKDRTQLLGMLCINVDVSLYAAISQKMLHLGGIEGDGKPAENHNDGPNGPIKDRDGIIASVFAEMGIDGQNASNLDQEKRLAVTERLMERGLFLIRGSVSVLAEKLGCSEASLYRYMGRINRKKG